MKGKQKNELSLKSKTLAIVGVVVCPLLALVLVFCFYTVNQAARQSQGTATSALVLYQSQMEKDLKNIESMMVSLSVSDSNYQELGHPMDSYEKYGRLYDVFQRYKDMLATYPIIGAMHLYSQENSISRTEYVGAYSYNFKQEFEQVVEALVSGESNPSQLGWFYQTIQGRPLLFRVFGSSGLYTACMIDPDHLSTPQALSKAASGKDATDLLFYADPQGDLAATGGVPAADYSALRLSGDGSRFVWRGWPKRYLVSSVFSGYSGSWLIYLQPRNALWGNLDLFQALLILCSVCLCLLIPVAVGGLNRSSFIPMAHLMETVRQIREGGEELRMEKKYSAKEFRALSATFQELLGQIKALKIESYEKEIQEQKTKLLLLQSQIRPHFYLNCLKNIQALAQRGQCQTIQDLVLELSAYLRHLFQSADSMVPLREELESIRSYMALQGLITSRQPVCRISVPDELLDRPIPPLSLLTFVENCVKHGQLPDRNLSVHIKAMEIRDPAGEYLNLTITDNGRGFPPEILARLSSGQLPETTGHVGIANALRRLEVIYDHRESCSFFNLPEGSCIDLSFPLDVPGRGSDLEMEEK